MIKLLILFIITTVSLFGLQNTKLEKLIDQAKKDITGMSPQKLKSLIDREKSVIVLDIREPEQKIDGQIYADETYEITRGNLEFYIINEVKNTDSLIVTYCRSGGRSVLAAQSLRKMGYKNATFLEGGMKAWANKGYPIETGLGVTRLKREDDTINE